MCCLGGNVIIATAQLFNKNIVIDTKRRPLSPPPCLRAGAGLSHRTQLQRYEDGEGTPKTRGFARGAEDLLIPGRLGCPLIVYFNTAGLF